MRAFLSAAVCACGLLTASLVANAAAQTLDANRISGPLVHENLAVYFIHGSSAPGTVPLTLEEAMASGAVKVRETSNVNQLEIENLGGHEVFVQSGDIVKGGKQDRTLMVSLLLPPHSGASPSPHSAWRKGAGRRAAVKMRGISPPRPLPFPRVNSSSR